MSRILVLAPWKFGWKNTPQSKHFEVSKNDFKLLKFITLRTNDDYEDYTTETPEKDAARNSESTE